MALPFISRGDLADYRNLGEDLSTSDAATIAIDFACDAVRDTIEQIVNLVQNEEITLDGTGTDALLLPERPVADVTVVVEDETELVVDDDYVLNGQGILLRVKPAVWTYDRQNVAVTYSHGWADHEIPRSIRGVALQCAARIFSAQSGTSAGVASESLGAYRIDYVTSGESASRAGDLLTAGEKDLLAKHRQSKSF